MPTEIFCNSLLKYFTVSSYRASLSALFACNTNFLDRVLFFFLPGSLCQDTVADNTALYYVNNSSLCPWSELEVGTVESDFNFSHSRAMRPFTEILPNTFWFCFMHRFTFFSFFQSQLSCPCPSYTTGLRTAGRLGFCNWIQQWKCIKIASCLVSRSCIYPSDVFSF